MVLSGGRTSWQKHSMEEHGCLTVACEAERGIDEGLKYQHCFKGLTAPYIPSIGTHFQDVLPFSSNYQVTSAWTFQGHSGYKLQHKQQQAGMYMVLQKPAELVEGES